MNCQSQIKRTIAGREALRLSAINEAIVHLERARQLLLDGLLPETAEADLIDMYMQLARVYTLTGQPEKALAMDVERDQIGLGKR